MQRHIFRYRCPECHHIVENGQLFEKGCPICGWKSPLKSKRVEEIHPFLETMADMLPSGTDLNAPGWREFGRKKRECPNCGNERDEEELMEKGCLICGWTPGPKIEKKRVEKKIIAESPVERNALVDVFEGPNYVEVVMDAREIADGDIKAEVGPECRKLIVSASSKNYRKEINLPCSVAGDPVISLKHSTLEVRVKKHAD